MACHGETPEGWKWELRRDVVTLLSHNTETTVILQESNNGSGGEASIRLPHFQDRGLFFPLSHLWGDGQG